MSRVSCPFCGERIEIWVDPGGSEQQEYIEDCSVCCRPIRLVAERGYDDGEVTVVAYRE
jgi:hypothetical protein